MKEIQISTENKIATIAREIFYTDVEIVAQYDAKKIWETMVMLVIEVD